MAVKRRLLRGDKVVQLMAILYLMFFIVSFLATTTNASFHDMETTIGTISVAKSFDDDQQNESNNTDPGKNNNPTKDEVDKDSDDEMSDQDDDSDSPHLSEISMDEEEDGEASEAHSNQVNKDENRT